MEIKDITRISFSTRRSSQQQGHLSICDSLFGKIVIDDQTMSISISEVFSDGTGGIGGQELKRGGFGSGGSDNDGVVHGSVISQSFDDIGNS